MAFWTVNSIEWMALLLGGSGAVLLASLYLFVRSSPPPVELPGPPAPARPQPLGLVLLEGFEVIELYDDVRPRREAPFAPSVEGPGEHQSVVRTAKVRDPVSGQVRLLRVSTSRQTLR